MPSDPQVLLRDLVARIQSRTKQKSFRQAWVTNSLDEWKIAIIMIYAM